MTFLVNRWYSISTSRPAAGTQTRVTVSPAMHPNVFFYAGCPSCHNSAYFRDWDWRRICWREYREARLHYLDAKYVIIRNIFSSRVLCPSLVTLCSHKSGRCTVELYHASHLWYPPYHETASSSAECSRDKPPFSFVRGQDSTM